ncbi:hypothetical protein B296_00008646 [Ensete ventricosum]|uniref:FH2 domain-containing protein n=1 Tax=Ensete ventricosum TaxID=4639 RepID=A0A427BB52_ENSVE|nr:hypothetical protein B296_00008646 [Ensete ventricosum]
MNDGTFRGGAQAFKLDTLLKLADVKGTDGKTTLLHFVVQEIIRSEGVRAVRMARESGSISSVNSDDLTDDSLHESEDYYCKLGLKVQAFVPAVAALLPLVQLSSLKSWPANPSRHGAPSRCYHEGSFSASRIFQLGDSYPDYGSKGATAPFISLLLIEGKARTIDNTPPSLSDEEVDYIRHLKEIVSSSNVVGRMDKDWMVEASLSSAP